MINHALFFILGHLTLSTKRTNFDLWIDHPHLIVPEESQESAPFLHPAPGDRAEDGLLLHGPGGVDAVRAPDGGHGAVDGGRV